ncbi:MAG: SDR family oxidoreductase, partial [Patescibacteria group bacterium]|nr:SDR family oxidoreductase [Patescibacteria group bacterium]
KTTPCPDIIINNAGIAHVGLFGEQPLDRWDKLMHVNLYAPMRICQYFLPDMKLRAQGHIVNISSIAGLVPLPGAAPYTASKYGLTGFSDAIREEYGRYGISVSSVHPFFTRTAILQSERFGTAIRNEPPWFLTESPESVVKEALLGIAAQQDYILPGVAAKAIDIIRRLNPRLISMIGRNMLQ